MVRSGRRVGGLLLWVAVAALGVGAISGGATLAERLGKGAFGAPGRALASEGAVAQSSPEPGAAARTPATPPLVDPDAIADIVERVGPAAVRINATAVRRAPDPFFGDPFFRQFFGDLLPQQEQVEHSLGTGVIVSADGYVVTNQHVIDGAQELEVEVWGEKQPYKARVVGQDRQTDLAVLKIEPRGKLTVATLGDSDRVRVGEWAIAIGNPYGFDHTVSVGVISAKGRPLRIQNREFTNLLQTDAAINPGNSGGPLLNLRGEVIGINTAIRADAQGIGFAIPSNTVKVIYEQLRTQGQVQRAYMGVSTIAVNEAVARYIGLPEVQGVLVMRVAPDSPAERAGIRRFDVIFEVDRQPVDTPEKLQAVIARRKPGDTVPVLLWREGQPTTVNVRLEQRPAE
ncbi:trypsin-like peptidase domain-containing protein [Caldinitratiruptor microaerophilus]|uniref:Peptidase S1 n=1 Tax=Caldinitratiruptor microaerophilus TaxID=671077 RepID=A0AA35CQF0_9FIRM|nr:trypsin-like peptidase domain-containing protein [Caldinitratiruptor microaerophilus]BDG62262.1 peptidase S1 [Caldinitratiruptor microaerophilus]